MNAGKFELLVLGCGSALPAYNRSPSSQVLNIHEELFLIDCGEGTQFQLSKYGIRKSRINHIFISHLHGDHVFGLPGLITSFSLLGRTNDLHIYGPTGIDDLIFNILHHSSCKLSFKLNFHIVNDLNGQIILDSQQVRVKTLPLSHNILTTGYLFEEKKLRKKIDFEKIEKSGIDKSYWKQIEEGRDIILANGTKIENNDLVLVQSPVRKFAYCSDTRYEEKLLPYLSGVDLLYHETTYLNDLLEKAKEKDHSTALQAAMIANKCKAKMLLTGHYSSRYEHLEAFETECKSVFQNVILGREGLVVKVE